VRGGANIKNRGSLIVVTGANALQVADLQACVACEEKLKIHSYG